jgi:glycerol kinase
VLGISRGTTAAHLARAALEGIAFQVADIVDALRQDSRLDLSELKVDGGASRNDTLMQHQADLLGIRVTRPLVTETTALGAAFLAGLGVGLWTGIDEVAALVEPDRVFEPTMDDSERRTQRARWSEAVERSRGWDRV